MCGFTAAVLGDAEEGDAVDDELDGMVEGALGKVVLRAEVFGEVVTPGFHLVEEDVVDLGGAFFLGGGGALVEGAELGGLGGEVFEEVRPVFFELIEGEVLEAADVGLVGGFGLLAAVVDAELFEVGEDGEGELDGPGVAAELEGPRNWGRGSSLRLTDGFLASTKNLRSRPIRKE